MTDATILIETPADGVGLIRLNRPKALNALNAQLIGELFDALEDFDADDDIGCMVITGNERAFAAGADIKYFAERTAANLLSDDRITNWTRLANIRKPIIAAVQGYALGGGCELAMAGDMLVAGEGALFGQPEIGIGIIPGAGGTQRLTHAVGKAIAMEMVLADRKLTADEAARFGLANRVVPDENTVDEAVKLAQKVASQPRLAAILAKDAVNAALDMGLTEGLAYEKRNFYIAFGTDDKTEGMDAFINKRKPQWTNK